MESAPIDLKSNESEIAIPEKSTLSSISPNEAIEVRLGSDESLVDKEYEAIFQRYRIKRWVLLTIYALLALFAGPTFFNFAPFQDLYYDDGAYAHKCHPGDATDDTYHACLAQRQAVASILPASVSVMFTFSFIGGILVDTVGPKVSALIGVTAQIIGWILIGSASPSFDGYKAGTIFLAIGVDPCFIAMLSLGNLFEGWSNTIVSVLGTTRSLAMGVGLVFRPMGKSISLKAMCYGYAVLMAMWFVIAFFAFPWKLFPKRGDLLPKEGVERASRSKCQVFWDEVKTQYNVLVTYGLSVSFLPMLWISMITFVRNNYYSSSIPEQLPKAKSYYEIMNVLSMLPCPLCGILSDKVCIELVIFLLNICGALMMGILLAKTNIAQYLSATFQWLVMSFLTSEFFCYCFSRFPQSAYGKLAGLLCLFGGLLSNVSEPMYNWASSHNDFVTFDSLLLACSLVSAVVISFLFLWNKKKGLVGMKS